MKWQKVWCAGFFPASAVPKHHKLVAYKKSNRLFTRAHNAGVLGHPMTAAPRAVPFLWWPKLLESLLPGVFHGMFLCRVHLESNLPCRLPRGMWLSLSQLGCVHRHRAEKCRSFLLRTQFSPSQEVTPATLCSWPLSSLPLLF